VVWRASAASPRPVLREAARRVRRDPRVRKVAILPRPGCLAVVPKSETYFRDARGRSTMQRELGGSAEGARVCVVHRVEDVAPA